MTSPSLGNVEVAQSNGTGFKEMVKPILAGNFIPLDRMKGRRFQMFMRIDTSDWWMNIDGNKTWLKIYEA